MQRASYESAASGKRRVRRQRPLQPTGAVSPGEPESPTLRKEEVPPMPPGTGWLSETSQGKRGCPTLPSPSVPGQAPGTGCCPHRPGVLGG